MTQTLHMNITQAQALQVLEMLRDCKDTILIQYIQVGKYDVQYNPYYNPYSADNCGWEIYEHDSDHTECDVYDDIYEASEVLIAQ